MAPHSFTPPPPPPCGYITGILNFFIHLSLANLILAEPYPYTKIDLATTARYASCIQHHRLFAAHAFWSADLCFSEILTLFRDFVDSPIHRDKVCSARSKVTSVLVFKFIIISYLFWLHLKQPPHGRSFRSNHTVLPYRSSILHTTLNLPSHLSTARLQL